MSKAKRRPWTGLEWGLFIAAGLLVLMYMMGWRILGLGDVLRFAERVLGFCWRSLAAFADRVFRFIGRIF